MKKMEKEQQFPKFKATTLRQEDLKQVTGGQTVVIFGLTFGTHSVCHKDGVDDSDGTLAAL